MSNVFAFRLSFSLAARSHLPFDSDRFLLSGDPLMVELTSGAPTLKQARQAALMGHGYPTETAAWIAGRAWRDHLARALVEHGIGADLGKDADAVLMPIPVPPAVIEQYGPTTWYKDTPGLIVVPDDTELCFGALGIEATAGPSPAALAAALQEPPVAGGDAGLVWHLAFGLWSDSVGVEDRFALMSLIRALEMLAPSRTPRPKATVDHLNKVIAELPADMQDLKPGILSLGYEPTQGRVLAMVERVLGPADTPARKKAIKTAFRVRNQYVHGDAEVTAEDVTAAVQPARELVRQVLLAWK